VSLPTIVIGKADRRQLVSAVKNALTHARPAPGASTLLSEIARAENRVKEVTPD
jgi:hypothetical protein